MNPDEQEIFAKIASSGVTFDPPTWETCRKWMFDREWRINVLSDYPRGEVKFTVRRGFERIEIMGHSDLEVLGKAIFEIIHRHGVEKPKDNPTSEEI